MKIIILSIIVVTVNAQYRNMGDATPSSTKPNPWFVGGMIGGSFSNYGGSFEISPLKLMVTFTWKTV